MCDWTDGRREPRLDDLFNEPIIRALMASDRVDVREVRDMLRHQSDPLALALAIA